MGSLTLDKDLKKQLSDFIKAHPKVTLITVYLFYIEKKYKLKPVLFPKEKTIYQSVDSLLKKLESEQKLLRETEILINVGETGVNEQTKKIYICPFTGKVFGDNTHPNPQDAIYEWVSTCAENRERRGGLKVKRFFVSEDPKVLKSYLSKTKKPIKKTVYSSAISGQLFHSKKEIIKDLKKNHIKELTLFDVQNQNRYQIEEHFLKFLQKELHEDKIKTFVEELSKYKEFESYLTRWLQ